MTLNSGNLRPAMICLGLAVLLLLSSFGMIRYEHIDPSFWKVWLVAVYAPFTAYFLSWHIVSNRHKRSGNSGYSLAPGIFLALLAGAVVAIPYSGLVLFVNAFGTHAAASERIRIDHVRVMGKQSEILAFRAHGERGGNYDAEIPRFPNADLQSGKDYRLEYSVGCLGVKFMDAGMGVHELEANRP